MKNIKIFAFLAIFLLSAAVSSAWAVDVTLTYKIDVQGALKPVAKIYDATNRLVASWDHGIKTLWPANEGHTMDDGYGITFTPDQDLDKTGENENKKSTSTTAFRTEKNTTFTVSVGEGFYFKSVTFKEDGTEKASSSNIAPNSTSISVSVPKNKFFNYITVVLTVDAYTVSVPENLTISDAFATINRVKYYKSGETVTLTAKENEIINTITGVTASNENVTINLAADRKTATFKMPSEDVTITATTTEVHTVSVPDGITLSDAFINISGTDYYKKGQTVTFGFSGSGSVVYFVNGERIEGNSVTVGQEDLTVQIGVPYIDENGKEQIRKPGEYTVLTSLTDVSNLPGGWYVVQGKVKYSNQVKFSGDAHLILADGAEMVIKSETDGIQADKNLTIYGQNGQSGILNDTANGSGVLGIYSKGTVSIIGGSVTASGSNGGIYSSEGVTINGGIVTATGYTGINGSEGVTINGGIVTATGSGGFGIYNWKRNVTINGGIVTATGFNAIYNDFGNITISGGSVTATGKNNGIYAPNGVTINGGIVTATCGYGYGIYSQNSDITLGWTNSTDFIKASSYKGSVQIAEGKSFKDEKGNVYSGSLTGEQLSAIKSKKLEPCYVVTFDAQNGDGPIMLPATFDENGVAYVKKPNDPIRSGFTFEGWFTATDGNTEFDFSAAITGNTTAYAKWSVPYIDEKGKPQIRKPGEYTVLTSLTDVSNLGGGWYVVQGKVEYSNQVKFSGDAHLILADGAEMEIETESKYGIYASNDLTIYGQNGQSDQSGTLKVTATGSGIYSRGNITIIGGTVEATGVDYGIYGYNGVTINGGTVSATGTSFYGIYSYSGDITIIGGMVEATGKSGKGINTHTGDITIIGGSVTATSDYGYGIYGDNGVTISGGKVEASGSSYGIYSKKNVTISGGSVTATGNYYGINSNSDITLGWTNSTDNIKASSYYSYKGSVQIAEGKSFKDENGNVYRGSLTGEQLSAIKGKKLEPAKPFPDNMVIADIPDQIYTGDSICPMADVTMPAGVDPLVKGEDYKVVCKENLNAGTATLSVQGVGIYYGEIKKTFTIAKASLTVTAKDKTIVYGDEPTNDGVEYDGFVGGENASVLGGELSYSYSYKKLDKAGKYTITPSGLTSGNYEITFAAGTLTVEKADISVDALAAKEKLVYNGEAQELVTAGKTNFGTLLYSLDGKKYSSEVPTAIEAKTYTVYYKVAEGDNWNALAKTIEVVIAKAPLTVTAKDKSIVYGNEPANDGVKYSGFVGEENEAVLGGELSYSYNYQKLDKVGEYTITPSGLTAGNYEITYAAGTLTVEKADISVDALVAKEKLVYSGKSQELVTAGKTNFGTLLYSLDGEKYSAEIPTATDAKTYTVYYKVAESDNWNAFEAKTIEVVIAKAPLTITAKDKTIAYGDEPANDGVEYSGFIGEENASVLGGELSYSYSYKKLDKVGKYTIMPSGLTASNYEISFVAGALNVEPKATHYAAVQVLEDENGKRAEIDGEYGEGDGIVITEPLEVASVEFSRDFSTQGYSTIVLPFDVNTSKLSGVDSVLSFARIVKEQGEMAVGMKVVWEASASHVDLKANTPYMVKMTGAKLGIDGGVTLLPTEAAVTKSDAQNDGWEFRGTYAYKSWQEGDEDLCRVYGFAGGSNDEVSEGDFVKFTAGASLRPLRAYLINTNRTCGAPKMARAYGDYVLGAKSSIDDLPESMKVVIVGEDGYTTVIGHFNTRTGEFTTGTSVRKFDLKGRAVRGTPSARGAYYGKRVKK